MKKFLHIIESKEDVEVAFDEYLIGVTYMVTVYVGRG